MIDPATEPRAAARGRGWRAMRPRTRNALGVGAIVLAGAGLVWALAARDGASDGDGKRKPGAARGAETRGTAGGGMAGMEGMEGMAGMDMGSEGSARLTADQVRQFGVTFGTVDERMLEAALRATGVVAVDESRVARLSPKVSGYAEHVYADFTGYPVRRGQPMLELYSPELLAAQEELLLARRLDRTVGESAVPGVPSSSANLLAAARRRLRLLDVSDAQIDQVLRSGRARRTVTLHAPAPGVVIEKNVVPGQAVAAGASLYTIADLSRVWVDVEVREADAAVLRPGVGADVEFTGLPGRAFKGRVEFVHPFVDPATRTVRARLVVSNAEGLLRPGMYATVRLSAPTRRALTVPSSAVVNTGERSLVFVDMGGGRLAPQEVEVGRAAGELTEVLAGVEPGQRVVTSAQFLLESESNLGEVMRSMMGQMGSGDMGAMPGMEGMEGMEGMGDMKGMPMPAPSRPASPRAVPPGAAPPGAPARPRP